VEATKIPSYSYIQSNISFNSSCLILESSSSNKIK